MADQYNSYPLKHFAAIVADMEIIEVEAMVLQGELTFENFIRTFPGLPFQKDFPAEGAVFPVQNTGNTGGVNIAGDVDPESTDLIGGQGAEGVFVDQLFAVEKNTHKDLLVFDVFLS